jgi:pyruvate formate lyase activating enzyme
VAWECFETVLPFVDVVLYDVKHVDDLRHRTWVGASNETVLRNLTALSERNIPTEVRLPLIPGFNLDVESLHAIGRFLSGLKHIPPVRLLPFHPAHSKFVALGMAEPMTNVEPPADDQVPNADHILKSHGICLIPA